MAFLGGFVPGDFFQPSLAKVGLAEEFPVTGILKDMNEELRKADHLEAALGRRFDLVSAKVNIFRSALEEMIDEGIGPTNEAYQELLDKLRRFLILQGKATEAAEDFAGGQVGFFGGLADQAKGLLDPQAILSTALGGILSGGISTLVSGVISGIGPAIGGLLGFGGPSEEVIAAREAQLANTEAVKKNVEAANRLADNLNALSGASVMLPFEAALEALTIGAERQRDEQRAQDPRSISNIQFDESILAEFGLSLADIEAIAKELKIEFNNLTRDSRALITAIGNINTFNRDFSLLQQQFALFDIEDPAERFASVMDLLASQVSDEFGAVLEGLTPENFDAFLEMFRAGFGEFDMSLLGDDITFDQFLTAIGFAEGALDGLASEVERTTAALRNAPAGFKVAAARFQASEPEPIGGPPVTDRGSGDLPGVPVEMTPAGDTAELGDVLRPITIEGDVVLQGVEDPRDFLRRLEEEVSWQPRTGASTFELRTRRR